MSFLTKSIGDRLRDNNNQEAVPTINEIKKLVDNTSNDKFMQHTSEEKLMVGVLHKHDCSYYKKVITKYLPEYKGLKLSVKTELEFVELTENYKSHPCDREWYYQATGKCELWTKW